MLHETLTLHAATEGAAAGFKLAEQSWVSWWEVTGGSLAEPNGSRIRAGLLDLFDKKVAPALNDREEVLPGSREIFKAAFRQSCADAFMVHLKTRFAEKAAQLAAQGPTPITKERGPT